MTAQTTAATTASVNTVTVTSASGIAIGQLVIDYTTANNVPGGTLVSNVSGTTITLSNNCLLTKAADTLAFFTIGTTDLTLSYTQAAQGETANIVVVS